MLAEKNTIVTNDIVNILKNYFASTVSNLNLKPNLINKSKKLSYIQKQTSRGVLRKRCTENIQQIYRRNPMAKCDFNKAAL